MAEKMIAVPQPAGQPAASKARRSIAVVQGAAGPVIQDLFRDFIERHRSSRRIAGLVETDLGPRGHLALVNDVATGTAHPLFQDLGPASTACSLRADGLALACHDLCGQIARGCDLVVISKFGKLEAERRGGLLAAFAAAIAADIPVLTSVAPKYDAAWGRFAAPYFEMLAPDADAIEAWWGGASAWTRRLPAA